jgi:hypothetical protein
MTLSSRRVLITGGGTGLGRDLARGFASAGAEVVVAGRTAETLKRTAAETGGAWVRADVTDPAQVAAMFEAAGPCDVVIASAGMGESAPFLKVSLDDWHRTLAVNLTGVFLTFQEGLRRMTGWGRLIAVASTAGLRGAAYVAPYAAAKHGVVGLEGSRERDEADDAVLGSGVRRDVGRARRPAVEATAIRRPQPVIRRSPSWKVRKTPVRFTARVRCQSSRETLRKGALSPIPALAITTSQGPAASNIAATWAGSVTSARTQPRRSRPRSVSASRAVRPATTTSAPAEANPRARSRPRPVPPP